MITKKNFVQFELPRIPSWVKRTIIQVVIGIFLLLLGYYGSEDGFRTYVRLRHYPEKTTGPVMFVQCAEFDKGTCWLLHPNRTATIAVFTTPGMPVGSKAKEIVYRDVWTGGEWKQQIIRIETYVKGEPSPTY